MTVIDASGSSNDSSRLIAKLSHSSTVKTTCPYCGVGCGVLIEKDQQGQLQLKGDPEHPANFGRLCSKGTRLLETLGEQERLTEPSIHGEVVSWEHALDFIAAEFSAVRERFGANSVAFYVSGQLLTEDYYVANKLMKGFLGCANIDTNSRLCMSSAVSAHKRAFGEDIVANCYEDIELADLVVLAGSNFAWCHPVLYQRLIAAKQQHRTRIIVIDPRRTSTCDEAELHLAIKPGCDSFLWNGLLNHLHQQSPWGATESAENGLTEALVSAALDGGTIAEVAVACGLSEADVLHFFSAFAGTEKTLTIFSQGINQSSSGVDKGNAIINCHILTNRIGKPGAGAFSITGQPNAMGGRETGGLATTLAAHMEFADADRVARFWHAPNIAREPGLKAVDLFEAIANGQIKAVWIMATNPAVSLPNADRVRLALANCPLVIISDCVAENDTLAFAHVRLPAAAWSEKDGTVTNSERCISRQRPFMKPLGKARPDWWIVTEVAKRMGFAEAFTYTSASEIFAEYAALTTFENNGSRALNLEGLTGLSAQGYEALAPVQWPVKRAADGGAIGTPRLLGEQKASLRLISVYARTPEHSLAQGELALITGRVRDHWHTLTRTGLSPSLSQHHDEPTLHIHSLDATPRHLLHNDLAKVRSRWGSTLARIQIDNDLRPGTTFVPMHWSQTFSLGGAVDAVVNPAVDPISGQPEFKHTPVQVEGLAADWQAVLIGSLQLPSLSSLIYAVRAQDHESPRWKIAGVGDVRAFVDALEIQLHGADSSTFTDEEAGNSAVIWYQNNRALALLFIANTYAALPAISILSALATTAIEPGRAHRLLAGTLSNAEDAGPTVCSCYGVGRNVLKSAIHKGARGVEELSRITRAGSNCGSCRPEIKRLIETTQLLEESELTG